MQIEISVYATGSNEMMILVDGDEFTTCDCDNAREALSAAFHQALAQGALTVKVTTDDGAKELLSWY